MEITKYRDQTIIKKEQGRNFRILQLTDIHIGGGFMSMKTDKLALLAVEKVVKAAHADFVVVTGDIAYPIPIFSGTRNNMRASKMFGSLMTKLGVPWTLVFGNHDSESFAKYTKDEIADYYMSLPNCYFQKGDRGLSGCGNYTIPLKNADGSLNNLLMFVDSNSYLTWNFFSGFDTIHDDQIEWYKNVVINATKNEKKLREQELDTKDIASKAVTANKDTAINGSTIAQDTADNKDLTNKNTENVTEMLSDMSASDSDKIARSLAFFHIPPKEFKDGWEKCYKGNSEATYHQGFVGEKDNYFGYPKTIEGKFFGEMVKLGSCHGMFMGHDHLSTLSLTYQGIRMSYGMSIDYMAYSKIRKKHTQRGGSIVEIDDNGNFEVKLLPLDDIV